MKVEHGTKVKMKDSEEYEYLKEFFPVGVDEVGKVVEQSDTGLVYARFDESIFQFYPSELELVEDE